MNFKSRAPIERSSILLTLILGSLQAVMPLSTDLYLPALPTIAQDLKVSPGGAQFTMAMFMVTAPSARAPKYTTHSTRSKTRRPGSSWSGFLAR